MIERFNFYDIYGYVIPGLTFVALLFVPSVIVDRTWPDLEWSSAFAFLICAYLSGLVLNRLIARFVSTTLYDPVDPQRPYRLPSDILLDENRESVRAKLSLALSDDLRKDIVAGIRQVFGLDVNASRDIRNDAFLMCRSLLQKGGGSYAEQFEGLYTLCQVVAAVMLLIGCYFLGWGVQEWMSRDIALFVAAVGTALVCVGIHKEWPFIGFPAIMFSAGVLLANGSEPDRDASILLLVLAVGSALVTLVLHNAFRYFAALFAVAVYRDFYVLIQAKKLAPPDGAG